MDFKHAKTREGCHRGANMLTRTYQAGECLLLLHAGHHYEPLWCRWYAVSSRLAAPGLRSGRRQGCSLGLVRVNFLLEHLLRRQQHRLARVPRDAAHDIFRWQCGSSAQSLRCCVRSAVLGLCGRGCIDGGYVHRRRATVRMRPGSYLQRSAFQQVRRRLGFGVCKSAAAHLS